MGLADILLLAAFGPELAPLERALAGSVDLDATMESEAESMAGHVGGFSIAARACGIGLAAAAAGAARHVREIRPEAVILLGTCGAYPGPKGLAIGDVIVSRRTRLFDPATLAGHTALPPPMTVPLDPPANLVASFSALGAFAAEVATTLGITVSDEVALRVARETALDVEHLEAFGVATACAAHAVPFVAVLGVANAVGSRGRKEWRANNHAASAAAAALVLRWIEQGAGGTIGQGPA
jgi:futalosine hydrolase